MEQPYALRNDVFILPSTLPVPGLGTLPANAFLVKGREPYLVDTGVVVERQAFVSALEQVIDPADLRWIVLTHDDPDHTGALHDLLARAPQAKLATSFISFAKLNLFRPISPDRLMILNPGERLTLSDRTLTAFRPPLFDAPETTGVYDGRIDTLFAVDAFGCPLTAIPRTANELAVDAIKDAQWLWATVDSPWVTMVDRARFADSLREIERQNPEWIITTHLPPAHRLAKELCANLAGAPEAAAFTPPSDPMFRAMLASLAGAAPATEAAPA